MGLLARYAEISTAFTVTSVLGFEAVHRGLGGWIVTEEAVDPPYEKDYSLESEGPVDTWLGRWDISHWSIFSATDGDPRVGGAIAGYGGPVELLDEVRDGRAVLWDIRVDSGRRGTG